MKMENELSHIGVLGMKWGHRSGSGWSGSKGQGRKLPKQVNMTKTLKKSVEQELVSKLAHKNLSDVDRAELNRGRSLREQEKLATAFQKKYTPQHFMLNTAVIHYTLTTFALKAAAFATGVVAGIGIGLANLASQAGPAMLTAAPMAALLLSDEKGETI